MTFQEQSDFFFAPKFRTRQEQIDFFFAQPFPKQPGPFFSSLHLARQEMQDCLIGTVVAEDAILVYPGKRHRLFATVMVIMSGIDLLAQFYGGSDDQGGVRDRFTAFAAEFMFDGDPDPDKFAEVLYLGCRNPLLHSFSFHQKKYRIEVSSVGCRRPVGRCGASRIDFVISVEALVQAFVTTVRGYEAAVRTRDDLQAKFTKMFPDYGSIGVVPFDDTVTR